MTDDTPRSDLSTDPSPAKRLLENARGRRSFLIGTAASIGTIAGCTELSGSSDTTTKTASQPTETRTARDPVSTPDLVEGTRQPVGDAVYAERSAGFLEYGGTEMHIGVAQTDTQLGVARVERGQPLDSISENEWTTVTTSGRDLLWMIPISARSTDGSVIDFPPAERWTLEAVSFDADTVSKPLQTTLSEPPTHYRVFGRQLISDSHAYGTAASRDGLLVFEAPSESVHLVYEGENVSAEWMFSAPY